MKIEELEDQLWEAEGIIVDLRGEFKEVQEQLEIMMHSQKKPLNEHVHVINEPVQECGPQDNAPNNFISQVSDALVDYEEKVAYLHPAVLDQKEFHTMNDTSLSVKSHLNQFHAPDDDCSSIIMQNREIDLCRNGSTQRICAFKGSFPNVRLPNTESEDPKFLLNIQSRTNADETVTPRQHANCSDKSVDSCGERLCSSKTGQSNIKNIPFGHLSHHNSSYKEQAVTSLRRSARRSTKYRAVASLQATRKELGFLGRTRLQYSLGPLKQCSSVVNVQSAEIPIGKVAMYSKNINAGHDLSCNYENVVCAEKGNGVKTRGFSSDKSHTSPNDALQDSVLVDVPISEGFSSSYCQLSKTVVRSEEGSGAYTRKASNDKSHTLPDDALPNLVLVDVPISEEIGSSHCQSAGNDRVLKFTFQRKRRKNVLGKVDENIIHDRSPLKRGLENPTNFAMAENGFSKMKRMGELVMVEN